MFWHSSRSGCVDHGPAQTFLQERAPVELTRPRISVALMLTLAQHRPLIAAGRLGRRDRRDKPLLLSAGLIAEPAAISVRSPPGEARGATDCPPRLEL